MAAHLGVFAREPLDLDVAQVPAQARVQLTRKVVVEFGQELDVEEEHGGRGQFVSDDIEEDFRALVFGRFGGTLG